MKKIGVLRPISGKRFVTCYGSNQIIMKTIWTFLFISIGFSSLGQSKTSYFVGIHPSFVKESFYEKNEFDINLIPLVFQIPIGKRVDLRGTNYYNYHFGEEKSMADVGLEVAVPIYFKKKEDKNMFSKGLYLSPTVGWSRNFLNDHNTLTMSIEPGYIFKLGERFHLSLYLQYGQSLFMYADDVDIWRQHFGIKVNLGFWNLFRK